MTSDTTSPPSTAFRAAGDLRLLTWPALDASGAGDFVFARQVHGAGVRVVTEADRASGAFSLDDAAGSAAEVGGADALVTTSPEVVLAILTADCVPIVLHDPVAGV